MTKEIGNIKTKFYADGFSDGWNKCDAKFQKKIEELKEGMFKLFGHETGGTMGEIDSLFKKIFADSDEENHKLEANRVRRPKGARAEVDGEKLRFNEGKNKWEKDNRHPSKLVENPRGGRREGSADNAQKDGGEE